MNMIRIAERDFHVRDQGAGPAVLLLHGIPTNGELWRDVAPQLASRARVIVPDLLGYGRSAPPAGKPVDITAQAGYMAALLEQLEIERATVVGHDIGGGVAQVLATRYPEQVERLGLVNSVCYDSWPIPEMQALKLAAPVVGYVPPGLTTKTIELDLRRGFVHKDRAEPFLDTFLEPFSDADGIQVFLEHVRALDSSTTERISPELSRLQIPVGVAWGEQDPFQKVHWGERLAADIPTAELTRIADASHFAPADAPDAVAAALTRLLERPPV